MNCLAAILLSLLLAVSGCGGGYIVKRIPDKEPLETDKVEEMESAEPAEKTPLPAYPHTVRRGETLRTIARLELGNSKLWLNLKEWNKVEEPLVPGSTLMIPYAMRGIMGGKPAGGTVFEAAREPRVHPKPRPPAKPAWQVLDVGERLVYSVKWFAITAGEGTMNVTERTNFQGKDAMHFYATARSRMVFFFKVDDRIESYSTADDLLPLQFAKRLHEGSYKKDTIVGYDREKMESFWGDKRFPLGSGCRDLLGAFFYYRMLPFPPVGKETSLCVDSGGKSYELFTQVIRRERVRLPAGEFDTVVVKPKIKFEGLWRQKGDIYIWLTDDERRIPVMVNSKVFLLGSVDIILMKMERWNAEKHR